MGNSASALSPSLVQNTKEREAESNKNKFFFVETASLKQEDIRDIPGTDSGTICIKLDGRTRVSDGVKIGESFTGEKRIIGSAVGWVNNPTELRSGNSSHPVASDPGRLLRCSGLIPSSAVSLSKALPTHHFASEWLVQNSTLYPERLRAISTVFRSQNFPKNRQRILSTGPFVCALAPDANGNEAMRLLITIESEATVEFFEDNNFRDIKYTEANNGITILANRGYPWVAEEIHHLGIVMVSESGGDIGASVRRVYINRGIMSVVYEGDSSGVIVNVDRDGEFKEGITSTKYFNPTAAQIAASGGVITALKISAAAESAKENHSRNGSIAAGGRRVYKREVFVDNNEFKFRSNPSATTFSRGNLILDTDAGAVADGSWFRTGTRNENLIDTIEVASFLRFAKASATRNSSGSRLVSYATIDVKATNDNSSKRLKFDDFNRLTREAIGEAAVLPAGLNSITIRGPTSGSPPSVSVSSIPVTGDVEFTPSATFDSIIEVNFYGDTTNNNRVDLTASAVIGVPAPLIGVETLLYDRMTLFTYADEIANSIESSAIDAIRSLAPRFYTREKVFGIVTESTAKFGKVRAEIESGHLWMNSLTGLSFNNIEPLTPFVSPDPGNNSGTTIPSKIKDTKLFLIGYPIGYHGSHLKSLPGEVSQSVLSVAGVKRLIYTLGNTVSADEAVVSFVAPNSEIVSGDTRGLSYSRPPKKPSDSSDAIAGGVQLSGTTPALMWEPVFGNEYGEVSTIARPKGFKIVKLNQNYSYNRRIPVPNSVYANFFSRYRSDGIIRYDNVSATKVNERHDIAKLLAEDFIKSGSIGARNIWEGEKRFAGLPLNAANNPRYVFNTIEDWGRESYRYARYIEMATLGLKFDTTDNVQKEYINDRVKEACARLAQGLNVLLNKGLVHPDFKRYKESKAFVGFERNVDSDVNYQLFDEVSKWQRIRYDRTMCEDPRGIRPVWGGLSIRLRHEMARWAVLVDSDGKENLLATKADIVVSSPNDEVRVVPLEDLETSPGVKAFPGASTNTFGYYSNHHRIFGYIFYAAYVAIRYGAEAQMPTEGTTDPPRSVLSFMTESLTTKRAAECGTGVEPFPLLLMLLDVIGPSSENDLLTAARVSQRDFTTENLRKSILNNYSLSEIAKISTPDAISRGVRAPDAVDGVSRPFPPHRNFDVYLGTSWSGGPTRGRVGLYNDASIESAFCYLSAYSLIKEAEIRIPSTHGLFKGYLVNLFTDKGKTRSGGGKDADHTKRCPYTAVVALAHEIQNAGIFKAGNDFESSLELSGVEKNGLYGNEQGDGSGNAPVVLNQQFLISAFGGHISRFSNIGVSRRTEVIFGNKIISSTGSANSIISFGHHLMPMVPGLSAAMNAGPWMASILNDTSLGGTMRPFQPAATSAISTSSEKHAIFQDPDDRVRNGATIGRWLDYVLLYSEATGNEDLRKWCRGVAAATGYKVRPIPKVDGSAYPATAVQRQVEQSDPNSANLEYYHTTPDPTSLATPPVFPTNKIDDNYLKTSSFYDALVWYRILSTDPKNTPFPKGDSHVLTHYNTGDVPVVSTSAIPEPG